MHSYQKGNSSRGNNTLFFVIGILGIVLLGLLYWGSSKETSSEELVLNAGPDSAAYADSLIEMVDLEESKSPIFEPQSTPENKEKAPSSDQKSDSLKMPSSKEPKPEASVEKGSIEENESGLLYNYKIRKGDTMYKVAAKFGNKAADVMSINNLPDMSIQADKVIKLKIKALHKVLSGEGLNAVSAKYAVPATSIKIANDLSSDELSEGQELIIPLK